VAPVGCPVERGPAVLVPRVGVSAVLEEELRPLGDAVTLWTLNLDDNDLGLMRLRDVYGELRKVMGGAQAARRLTSAGA